VYPGHGLAPPAASARDGAEHASRGQHLFSAIVPTACFHRARARSAPAHAERGAHRRQALAGPAYCDTHVLSPADANPNARAHAAHTNAGTYPYPDPTANSRSNPSSGASGDG
jgi:hypothetical protein